MSTVLQGQDTVIQADLYMSLELGDKKWMLTLSEGRRSPSRYNVDAGDTAVVADCIRKAKERCGLPLTPAAKYFCDMMRRSDAAYGYLERLAGPMKTPRERQDVSVSSGLPLD